MTIQRMEHVGIVVDDFAAATAFFVELGPKLQGEGQVEGAAAEFMPICRDSMELAGLEPAPPGCDAPALGARLASEGGD